MIFIQEASLPKLTQTSLYSKFETSSGITANIKEEISNTDYLIKPDSIPEMISLMKLNGDSIVKKAIESFQKGDINLIFNKETSKIPMVLPYLIINKGGVPTAYVFGDKFMDNITSSQEYTKLMAGLEAAYLALELTRNPNKFIHNRQLMLTLCNLYMLMVAAPLEQKLYVKGENLVKAMLYIIGYFYRMIDGIEMDIETIPYKRLMSDKIDPKLAKDIFNQVRDMEDFSFMGLINLIININPTRYADLETMYMSYFTATCGVSLIFAIENLSYLFLLMTSTEYRTTITAYSLNKTVGIPVKKAITTLTSVV